MKQLVLGGVKGTAAVEGHVYPIMVDELHPTMGSCPVCGEPDTVMFDLSIAGEDMGQFCYHPDATGGARRTHCYKDPKWKDEEQKVHKS